MKALNFLQKTLFSISIIVTPFMLSSCNDEEINDNPDIPGYTEPAKQTLFMYMPWSGGGNMYQSLLNNITSFEKAIEENHGTNGNALLVSYQKVGNCQISSGYITMTEHANVTRLSNIISALAIIPPLKE